MSFIKKNGSGMLLCLAIAIPAWYLGKLFPVVGGPVLAILIGLLVAMIPRKPVRLAVQINARRFVLVQICQPVSAVEELPPVRSLVVLRRDDFIHRVLRILQQRRFMNDHKIDLLSRCVLCKSAARLPFGGTVI